MIWKIPLSSSSPFFLVHREIRDYTVIPSFFVWCVLGTVLPLTEENVEGILAACREEIGTMFGYTAENRGVGITGAVDFVEMDGPVVVLSLKGRFWHTRPMVLARVGAYISGRIPEIVDVDIDDPYELTDEANNAAA